MGAGPFPLPMPDALLQVPITPHRVASLAEHGRVLMSPYQVGDEIRVDIPDPSDSDHRYHGETGTIVDVSEDDLGGLTGQPRDDYLYTVEFDDSTFGTMDFRHDDLQSV